MPPRVTVDPHKNYSPDWSTPGAWCAWARFTLRGNIDLDPCSTLADNERVGASRLFTAGTDGLSQPWDGTVYCNPPGSNSSVSTRAWWEHAYGELAGGRCRALVWCLFNCEHARHLDPSPFDTPGWLVIPQRRISFLREGVPIRSPRNWAWFWSTLPPADTPEPAWVQRTGNGRLPCKRAPHMEVVQ